MNTKPPFFDLLDSISSSKKILINLCYANKKVREKIEAEN